MAGFHAASWTLVSGLLLFWTVLVDLAHGQLVQTYCSNQNTGPDDAQGSHPWQTNGYCFDQCKDNYAFAVIQGNYCWCSNYIPGNQLDVSDCSAKCPGYPDERCGSPDSGLYGYVPLLREPSGTLSASIAAATSEAPSTSPSSAPPIFSSAAWQPVAEPETVVETVTESAPVVTSLITLTPSSSPSEPSSSSSPPSSSLPPSSTPPSTTPPPAAPVATQAPAPNTPAAPTSAWTPTPVTTVQVITISGEAVTHTVTTTPTAPPEAISQTSGQEKVSGGTIAGAVVGAVAGVAAIAALLLWLLLFRRRRNDGSEDSEKPRISPRRNTSTMSRTGLLKTEKTESAVPTLTRNSVHGMDNVETPISERRNSRPLFFDSRLNPSALMDHDNGSHASVISMQDNRDYTRTLGVRNPDPTNSFDKDARPSFSRGS